MHSLQNADTIDPLVVLELADSKAVDATIGDASTLYEPYPLEFWQASELRHTAISQGATACEVDVTDAIASLGQSLDTDIGDAGTVPKVDVMKVLAEFRDSKHSSVSDLTAFCQNKITKSGTRLDDPFDTLVSNFATVR